MARRDAALLILLGAVWGSVYPLTTFVLRELPPPAVVLARTGLSALGLLPLAARRHVLRPAAARPLAVSGAALLQAAIPLVLLLFGSVWLFPLVTALVAGDIIAAEHHNGTLKTIFTRSLDRGQIFAGKLLAAATHALLALGLLVVAGIAAGLYPSWRAASLPIAGTLREEAVA